MAKKPQSLFIRIVGPIVILGCLGFTIASTVGALSKHLIVVKLDSLATSFAKHAEDNGKTGKLTYGDIVVEGWGFKKFAVIHNLSATVSEKGVMDSPKWSLSTASVVVTADPFIENQLYFTFPDPLNVIENSELKSTINFPKPPKYTYFDGKRNKVNLVEHVLALPEQLSIIPAKPVDDVNVNKAKALTITYDADPVIKNTLLVDSKEHNATVEFKNVKINSEDGTHAMMGLFSSKFDEKQTDAAKLDGKYLLQVSDLLLLVGDNAMKPYNITADLTTHSTLAPAPEPKEGQPASTEPVATSADITINQLSVVTSDFDIKADGTVSEALDDPLLYGNANLTIDNVPGFLASELISQQAKGAVSMALEKIAGVPVDQATNIAIPLKREKNGIFYVNNITFEELATSLFTDLMKAQQDAAAAAAGGAAIDATPPATTLPPTSPTASAPAGAAPYAPVVSAPVAAPAKPTPAEKFQKAVPAAGAKQ